MSHQPLTYWKESDGTLLGYLNQYPDHWTQGQDLEDLKENLRNLSLEFAKDDRAGIGKVEDLLVV